MTKSRTLALGLAAALFTAACSTAPATTTPAQQQPLGKVLFGGDSIAAGEALPLRAAFEASGVEFQSIASEGGGNVVGPFSEENWPKIAEHVRSARPAVVVHQLTTYDWGAEDEQRAGYRRLLQEVTGAGAQLVLVTAPPIRPDEFYAPHMAELERVPSVVKAMADASSGQAVLLDASAVWGTSYQQQRDGKADRSADGIHTCPQGAARFTQWLLTELKKLHPGFSPAEPEKWANSGWSADRHFAGC
ncbi:hypothetical protein SAMN05216553_108268 [Lentzea fradiae]|uniref:Lysophospholipase L1 n=1 Tax=Lentzea fradiae TaxID=200378 RepID=A0A1G7UKP2_9PSEU|nr:SGNH/GDSL hydrolase family protein [Lentzea fradiae]SDG48086.1 hypothetical protein SAMN05216553_108268 [Lentzea fradiae]